MKKIDLRAWVIPLILLFIWTVVSNKNWVDRALLPLPQDVWQVFLDS